MITNQTYLTPGIYTVTLNIDGDIIQHDIEIVVPPVPTITPSGSVCLNSPATQYTTNLAGLPQHYQFNWSVTSPNSITSANNTEAIFVNWISSGTLSVTVTEYMPRGRLLI